MSTIHLHRTTTATPEQYIAGLTDFGPGRSKLFGNSADAYIKVHHKGSLQADVTEGSSGIWERLHYDWSDPDRVVLTTTDSNVWGGARQTASGKPCSIRWNETVVLLAMLELRQDWTLSKAELTRHSAR